MDSITEYLPEQVLMAMGLRDHICLLFYRLGTYAVFNLLDDPAMLAFAFS